MKKITVLFLLFNLIFINKSVFYLDTKANFITNSLKRAYYNIEYPKRFVNSLLQRDMQGAKQETKRFLINSILAAAILFDTAYKVINLELMCLPQQYITVYQSGS